MNASAVVRSIVVALDGSASSRAAQEMAFRIARRYDAAVVGVGVVDVPAITAPMAVPIGGGAYKAHRDQTLLDKGRAEVQQRLAAFEQACSAAAIRCVRVGTEGTPHEQIEHEADRHDLIVIGRDTNFHSEAQPDIAESVQRLLRDAPRPVLVVPSQLPAGDKVVVAFDGSPQASRAMHMFVLLGLAEGREVHILSIQEREAEAQAIAERAAHLFRSHGLSVVANGIGSAAHPAEVLCATLDGMQSGMLVMGAFSYHGLVHRIFVGSATRRLLDRCPVPLFVHH